MFDQSLVVVGFYLINYKYAINAYVTISELMYFNVYVDFCAID